MASRAVSSGGMSAFRRCRLPTPGAAAATRGQPLPLLRRSWHMIRQAGPINSRLRLQPICPSSETSYHEEAWAWSSSPCRSWFGGTERTPHLKRHFSLSIRSLQGEKDEAKKSPATSGSKQPPTPARGIRKVIPISIPSLTPHENIYTIPNFLTFSRLIVSPFIGYAIVHDAHAWAMGLFVYAGVSDLLDGWIARRWKLQTVVGSIVDPMADKILMTVLTVSLAAQGSLPVWLAAIILGRDVGLAISAIYYRWISLPPPKTFTRYWDFSLPSAEVRPTTISKYNTFLQLGLMGATMINPLVAFDASASLTFLQYTVAATTIWSGLSYAFSKDAVKILSQNKKK